MIGYLMLNPGITVWNHNLLDDFLSELEAHPQSYKHTVLISPFMNLGANSRMAKRLRHLASTLARRGVTLDIVSDLTPFRASSFLDFLTGEPLFKGFLGLCPKLHSKCGYAVSKVGAHIAFVGSANFTDAALSRNTELVIALKASPAFPETCNVFNQIKQQADEVISRCAKVTKIPTCKPIRALLIEQME